MLTTVKGNTSNHVYNHHGLPIYQSRHKKKGIASNRAGLGPRRHRRKSITRWENNYEEYGRVDPQTVLRGRPRILTTAMTEDLREIIDETPSLFLDEIDE